jgi:(p)ppGpp synthase/HD superfamily hydrolase
MQDNSTQDQDILYALEFAAVAHQNQLRKNIDREVPYISHPAAVGFILQEYGLSMPVVIAGILHDTIEDTTVTPEVLKAEFGAEVYDLVVSVTEDKALEFVERKKQYFERIQTASFAVKAISAADQIANMSSTLIMHRRGENLRDSVFKHGTQAAEWVAISRRASVGENFEHPIKEKLNSLTKRYLQVLQEYARQK